MNKTAVILFNLGGPDMPDAIKPFLYNLFTDRNIIGAPRLIRLILARLISSRREAEAREIYAHIGGRSPILPQTQEQANALELALGSGHKVFIAMRYWHPRMEDVAREIMQYDPQDIILLPLYPQYSTTTSYSSIEEFFKIYKGAAQVRTICCYATHPSYIAAQVELISKHLAKAQAQNRTGRKLRLLFSAHGLPKKIVDKKKDPYKWQVEQAAQLISQQLEGEFEPVVCYQSKVGPLEWLTPSTEEEIARAGHDGCGVVIVPIAFVSEHSETLVELDIEYKELADEHHVPSYTRVPTLQNDAGFIKLLADLCGQEGPPRGKFGIINERICPQEWCACRNIYSR